jgi:hypothetical protein
MNIRQHNSAVSLTVCLLIVILGFLGTLASIGWPTRGNGNGRQVKSEEYLAWHREVGDSPNATHFAMYANKGHSGLDVLLSSHQAWQSAALQRLTQNNSFALPGVILVTSSIGGWGNRLPSFVTGRWGRGWVHAV